MELTIHKPEKLRINCGCWRNLLPGYVNIDMQVTARDCEHGADIILHNINDGIPCGDGEACEVRADQFIEHLTLPQIVKFLDECKRVLCENGELRIEFPDIMAAAEGPLECGWVRQTGAMVPGVSDELVMLNLLTHEWGHRCILTMRHVLPMVRDRFSVTHAGVFGTNATIIGRKHGAD